RRDLYARGLGSQPDDARHHFPCGRAQRHWRGRLSLSRAAEPNGRELASRLREGDLSAAPAVLNLVENRSPDSRQQSAELLAALSPAALGHEAPGHIVGITGPPGVGKSTLLSRLT